MGAENNNDHSDIKHKGATIFFTLPVKQTKRGEEGGQGEISQRPTIMIREE